jgi:hypothetical protein
MNGYDLHPEFISDVDEIWEFIAEDGINSEAGCCSGFSEFNANLAKVAAQS